ncbi:hypothetical protein DL765_002646 [Monosporascus sp. GIB2]|nr:hypothetical protein DL765_002646 [Monosporascus sp. GIB2]
MEAITSNLRQCAVIATVSLILWQAVTAAYNLFLHPLRRFPGPLAYRASPLPWALRHVLGRQAFDTQRLHERYGPVVRLGPGHLSFTDPRAWRDIYGHRPGDDQAGRSEMLKSRTFYAAIRALPLSIINADSEEHSRYRRALSHGFSESSMRQQEPLIARYVDLLLERLAQECGGGRRALNMETWYNYTTFDIIGDLVFGHSFDCLETAEYHPWISFIKGSVRSGAVINVLSYVGLDTVVQWIWRLGGFLGVSKMQGYVNEMLASRLGMEKDRDDLFEGLVKRREEWNLSFEQLGANAYILVIGGSETTATALSGATYLLLTHRDVLEKLNREVRSAFASADEITISSVSRLSYMLAVLNESLRLYPPLVSGLVRVVPPAGEHVAGHWVPGGTNVEVQEWSINHSEDNWEDPWAFRPERFLRDADAAAGSGDRLDAHQPFSFGPRNCIGRNLAYAEMRLILARIVYGFDMKLADDSTDWIKRQKTFILWDRIPLNVYLTPVQRRDEAA